MLKFQIGGITCEISLLFPAVFLCLLYVDIDGTVINGFLAAILHECGHIFTAMMLRYPIRCIVISCFGMRMVCTETVKPPIETALIALSGPVTNALCAVLFRACLDNPTTAQIHTVLAVFNLLPIMPLDGGMAVDGILQYCVNRDAVVQIESIMSYTALVLLAGLGVVLLFSQGHNITLLLVSIYLFFLKLFYNGN